MSNRSKGARAYLRKRKGRKPVWVIRDGQTERVVGSGGSSDAEIERALGAYLGTKHRYDTSERDPAQIQVIDVLTMYADNFAIHHACPKLVSYHLKQLIPFWAGKDLTRVRGSTCRAYVEKRVSEGRKPETARRELETLQAAIRRWHKESPLDSVPAVTLPPKAQPRERYLERSEAAALLRAARALGHKHIARFILIGLYTGTRHNAILSLRWVPGLAGGHIDLERAILFRRGRGEQETSKRRPPVRVGLRLLSHLRRWQAIDAERGIANVISYRGQAIAKERRAFAKVVKAANLGQDVTPHTLRHTCATWALWEGKTIWEVAGLIGASALMVERVYGHHLGAGLGHRTEMAAKRTGTTI